MKKILISEYLNIQRDKRMIRNHETSTGKNGKERNRHSRHNKIVIEIKIQLTG